MTRHALAWLLVAQFGVMAPQFSILPLWTSLVWAVVAFWHWRIYRGDWHFPPAPVKWLLVLLALLGIYAEYRTPLELEPQLALLVSAFILKLLELKSLRDQWIVICLGYFIVACGFIFEQTMMAMLIATGQLMLLLLAQQAMFRERTQILSMLRVNWRLLYQSLPLMLLLFVVFPRFGPLWAVPLPGDSARTGLSDSMAPGDIARLSRSGELAFRVAFDGDIPPSSQLYWRGLVLENYDGRRWTRSDWVTQYPDLSPSTGPAVGYEVTLEPGVHEWALAMPVAVPGRSDLRVDHRYQLLPRKVLTGRLHYRVTSYLGEPLAHLAPSFGRYVNLRLPDDYNPRSRALADQWRQQYDEPADRVQAARRYFLERPFVYTLEPPTLGEQAVDEFLFGTRRGFCEHYAGTLVFLMRAAGVPARVVLGYQGGERNPDGNYLLVHQSDAHAWTEVWLEGRGWVRIDPTGWVAPTRIEQGADSAYGGESAYLSDSPLSLRRFSAFLWVNRLRLWMDELEYAWAKWVLNYDSERQWELLSDLLGSDVGKRLAMVVIAVMGLSLGLAALLTLRLPPQQRREPAVRLYLQCCAWLERRGIARRRGEAPQAFAQRVARETPEWGEWIEQVTREFYVTQYEPLAEESTQQAFRTLGKLRRRPYRSRQQWRSRPA